VSPTLRGKYLAFSSAAVPQGSSAPGRPTHGQAHLKALRSAGLTHVHLLPSYDFGSVPERVEEQRTLQVLRAWAGCRGMGGRSGEEAAVLWSEGAVFRGVGWASLQWERLQCLWMQVSLIALHPHPPDTQLKRGRMFN